MARRGRTSSGDPGRRPPAPGSLPRPALWPGRTGAAPFDGAEPDTAVPTTPRQRRLAWLAVALMVVGTVLVGLAVALPSWVAAGAGLVIGAVGMVLAWRARIMEDVSVSD